MTDETFNLGELADDVVEELGRRLRDPKLRKELPGTGLIQLAKQLLQLRSEAGPVQSNIDVSVLEMVQNSSLPDERKKEILLIERERLEEQLELVNIELEDL